MQKVWAIYEAEMLANFIAYNTNIDETTQRLKQ